MDAGSNLGSPAKRSDIGLEVAGSGLVSCRFFIPFFSVPCMKSLACLVKSLACLVKSLACLVKSLACLVLSFFYNRSV